ncbi:MAG: DUF2934 domain-containing protein, partial [Roseiarcus sp.]|uniref:DUF2934 domain-containing protein n=1 Tax=Roseiarcus sp. TaxID=1969460 RepID=UPI003C20763B
GVRVAQHVVVPLAGQFGGFGCRRNESGGDPLTEGRRDEQPISPRCRHPDEIQARKRVICLNGTNRGTAVLSAVETRRHVERRFGTETEMSGIHELVRERAYELWQRAGSPEGRSDEFWFAAEHELEDRTAIADGEADILVPSVDEPPVVIMDLRAPTGVSEERAA